MSLKPLSIDLICQGSIVLNYDSYNGQQKITFRLLPEEKYLVYTNWGMLIPNMQTEFLHHVRIFSYDDMPI